MELLRSGIQIDNLIGDFALLDTEVRGLEKTKFIRTRPDRKMSHETNVWTLRRLNGTDASVVRGLDVAHLKPCTLARQTPGTHRRDSALVFQFRQRVDVIHKLRELRRGEELTHCRHDWARVDQLDGRYRRQVKRRHAVFHDPLHARKSDPQPLLKQLAKRSHAPVTKVVNLIRLRLRVCMHRNDLPD